MIVNISPADYNLEETHTSLYYAYQVKNIVNESMKNVENLELVKVKEENEKLNEENDKLKKYIQKS
jgi:uncharacterized protein YpuA (DUF1002 family)